MLPATGAALKPVEGNRMAIIVISRGSLSGGEELAEMLGKRLGARVLSREVIVQAAKKYGVDEERLIKEMDSPPGLWNRLTHQKEQYILAVQASLAEMVQEGKVIYHGHAGQLLLQPLAKVIKVRLIAPLEYRIRSAMMEFNFSREEAAKHIETVDERRTRWMRQLFDIEWADPTLYDLVLNLANISLDTATEMVVDLAGRPEYRRTPELEQERIDFALATRVRAELTFTSGFPYDSVEVNVARGAVRLSGGTFFERNQERVVQFVQKIEGVSQVVTKDEISPGRMSEQEEQKARDIMLPISSYPFIRKGISIREAFSALCSSSVKLNDGHVISPRYLLVHDELARLVGVVDRRSLLRGLVPELKAMERARSKAAEIAHMPELTFPVTFCWGSLFSEAAFNCAKEPVETIMVPVRASVHPEDDLSVVIAVMLQRGVDLVPVIDEHRPVGVILMTDVFDTVAEHLLEEGSHPRKSEDG
jgi:cytidylate kinase/CBS domain-containing protein